MKKILQNCLILALNINYKLKHEKYQGGFDFIKIHEKI